MPTPHTGMGIGSSQITNAPKTASKLELIQLALAGTPQRIDRGGGKVVTIFPPSGETQLDLALIKGTHASVASSFSDGRTVADTTEAIVANPNILQSNPKFTLTVFRSTRPEDPGGPPYVWSMNNRRLKAMQDASKRKTLPKILVKWADASDIEYAIVAGKFDNDARADVGFHSTSTKTARLGNTSHMGSSSSQVRELTKEELEDPEKIANIYGF